MTTVLLADDEDSILNTLVRNIDWSGLQLHLVGSVSNGQKALECMEKTPPDILITDVSMPIMSGMDLAQYIYENKLPVKVVILSGHQEFKYAQQAIRYNVTNYLVKPCEKQQLNETLKELAAECIREKKELLEKQYFESFIENCKPQLREKLLQDLVHGNIVDQESLAQKCSFLDMDPNIQYYVIAAEVDNYKEKFHSLQEKQKFFATLHMSEALSSSLPDVKEAVSLSVSEGCYTLLIPDYASDDIISLCNCIRETFGSFTGLSATYGIGGPAVGLMKLGEAYAKASETLLYKYLAGNNTVICYEDITMTTASEKHLVSTMSLQTQIIQATRAGDSESIEALCEEWFRILENGSPALIKSLIIQFVGNLSVELLETGSSLTELFGDENLMIEKVLRFDTIFDVKLWLRQILQYICDYIREKNQKNTYRLAKKAAQYIDEHYMESINVDIIASAVYLSSGYLMTIFKREIGTSINSYLVTKRIERAKELLLEGDLKVYEIAEKVGYANTTFFSSTFRNHVGVSPKQFKDRYLNDNASSEE